MIKIILVLRAYLELLAHDIFMSRYDFAALHERVRAFPVRKAVVDPNQTEAVASALDLACCFYPTRALCLQRSAVLVKTLRYHGIPAHMVIGAQKLPFRAHAWVEVEGHIIHDRLATREKFLRMEVC